MDTEGAVVIHGGEIYDKKIEYDFSVNLNPVPCPQEVMKALTEAVFEASCCRPSGARGSRSETGSTSART